jgi:arabinogalactan oligomer / maltooligosaccharide transport system permease protein
MNSETDSRSGAASMSQVDAKNLAPRSRGFVWWLRDVGWRHIAGITMVVFAMFPVLLVLSASFNRTDTLGDQSLIPSEPTLRHYRWLFTNGSNPFPEWLRNTLIVAFSAATSTVILTAMGSYAFSRFRFKGRKGALLALLVAQMFPGTLLVTAIYLLLLKFGKISSVVGTGSVLSLILVYLGVALAGNIWLMKSFFDTLPMELDESAKVDGATHFQTFVSVILPLAAPILATIFLFSFIAAINEYAIAATLLRGNSHKYTVAYGLADLVRGRDQNWGRFAAGSMLAGVPVLLVFQFLQRYLIGGLTAGAVKG